MIMKSYIMRLGRLTKSFRDASRGLKRVFQSEQNFRLQLVAGAVALGAGAYLHLRSWEMVVIILLSGWVLTIELLNTAFEYFSDLLKPRLHHYVGVLKDVMAAAVLVSSISSLIIGLIIFLPYLFNLIK